MDVPERHWTDNWVGPRTATAERVGRTVPSPSTSSPAVGTPTAESLKGAVVSAVVSRLPVMITKGKSDEEIANDVGMLAISMTGLGAVVLYHGSLVRICADGYRTLTSDDPNERAGSAVHMAAGVGDVTVAVLAARGAAGGLRGQAKAIDLIPTHGITKSRRAL